VSSDEPNNPTDIDSVSNVDSGEGDREHSIDERDVFDAIGADDCSREEGSEEEAGDQEDDDQDLR